MKILPDHPIFVTMGHHGEPPLGELSVYDPQDPKAQFYFFSPKRVYWITNVGDFLHWSVGRGGHAHHQVKQVFFCLKGKITIRSTDGRHSLTQTITGEYPQSGAYIPPMWWHEMQYRAGSICLAIASEHHDEKEYIRDRAEFDRLVAEKRKAA